MAAAFVLAAPSWAKPPVEPHRSLAGAPSVALIDQTRKQANEARRKLGLPAWRTTRSYADASPEYRRWALRLWAERRAEARRELRESEARWERLDRDWHAALHFAADRFGVSFDWLHACNHSEGGHGMGWNYQGSGAFGPMQFMEGTFLGMSRRAFEAAPEIPDEYRRWDSRLGQAVAAAWAFSRGYSYHWVGSGC